MCIRDSFEEYAGSGTYSRAHLTYGGEVRGMSEINPIKRKTLEAAFPGARIDSDARTAPPVSDVLTSDPSLYGGGFSCKMVAPNGPQLGMQSKHANDMRLFVDRARSSNASAVWFENVYNLVKMGLFLILITWLSSDGDTPSYHLRLPDGVCLLYTSPSPRDQRGSRMPSSA